MPVVEVTRDDHVAVVTINRPERRNAFSPEVLVLLAATWEEVRADPEIRVAVITGAGGDAFSAGADLGLLIPLMTGARSPEDEFDEALIADPQLAERALLRTYDTGKPVVAAINGFAIAGGMELALACDLRIAADGARLGLQEAKWGLFPLGGATVRLPRQIPEAIAMEMLLTGDLLDARRGLEVGLINRVVPQRDVLGVATHYAQTIADNGPLAVQAIRRSAREAMGLPEAAGLVRERELGLPVFQTADAVEGPKAFMEKRRPEFTGR